MDSLINIDRCNYIGRDGAECGMRVKNASGRCTQHGNKPGHHPCGGIEGHDRPADCRKYCRTSSTMCAACARDSKSLNRAIAKRMAESDIENVRSPGYALEQANIEITRLRSLVRRLEEHIAQMRIAQNDDEEPLKAKINKD